MKILSTHIVRYVDFNGEALEATIDIHEPAGMPDMFYACNLLRFGCGKNRPTIRGAINDLLGGRQLLSHEPAFMVPSVDGKSLVPNGDRRDVLK